MSPVFSIVIPGFNRPGPLKYTLRSAAAAAARLPAGDVEIVLVDDGSSPPLVEQLAGFDASHAIIHLRQRNQGSIVARLAGFSAARGDFVLFLDSDDLIHPDKLVLHLQAARRETADITYDDMADAKLGPDFSAVFQAGTRLGAAANTHDLLLRVQPPPHGPIFRRDFLQRALAGPAPLVPPDRRVDAAGDVWLYYNLITFPARIAKVDAPLTAIGPHEETRYSVHWEKLGAASLRVAEAFQQACSETEVTLPARRAVGEVAFLSWRRLPHDFHPAYSARLLRVWRRSPKGPVSALGGGGFSMLARLVGPVVAGAILRRLRGNSYATCRTLDDEALGRLLET